MIPSLLCRDLQPLWFCSCCRCCAHISCRAFRPWACICMHAWSTVCTCVLWVYSFLPLCVCFPCMLPFNSLQSIIKHVWWSSSYQTGSPEDQWPTSSSNCSKCTHKPFDQHKPVLLLLETSCCSPVLQVVVGSRFWEDSDKWFHTEAASTLIRF